MTHHDDWPTQPFRKATRPLEALSPERLAGKAPAGTDGLTCARCGRPTGNEHQGHYFSTCAVTGQDTGFHFCCPGNCELREASS